MTLAVWTTERDGSDALPLEAFARVGSIRYSSAWSGGCDGFSCTLGLSQDDNPRAVLEGRRLTVHAAGVPVWSGLISDGPRGEPWTVKAEGLSVQAVHTEAVIDTGDLSYQVSEHVNYAITRGALVGWQPTTLAAVPNLPTGPVYNLTTIADLLNLSAASSGRRWGVDAFDVLQQPVVPTTPDVYAVGDVAPMGRTMDGFATHIAASYLNETDPSGNTVSTVVVGTPDATVTARFGRVEAKVDVTKYGLMNASEAASVIGGLLSLIGPRASFTGKVPLTARNLMTPGGVPFPPALVQAGQLIRFQGSQPGLTSGEVGKTHSIDVLIGATDYDHDLDVVAVSPVQTRPRGMSDILGLVAQGEREQAFALAAS